MNGIYANIWGILMGSMLPYMAYMDPMGNVRMCQVFHDSKISIDSSHSSLSRTSWDRRAWDDHGKPIIGLLEGFTGIDPLVFRHGSHGLWPCPLRWLQLGKIFSPFHSGSYLFIRLFVWLKTCQKPWYPGENLSLAGKWMFLQCSTRILVSIPDLTSLPQWWPITCVLESATWWLRRTASTSNDDSHWIMVWSWDNPRQPRWDQRWDHRWDHRSSWIFMVWSTSLQCEKGWNRSFHVFSTVVEKILRLE